MTAEASVIIGRAVRGIPIILAFIGAGMTVTVLRHYLGLAKQVRTGLLKPQFVWSATLSLLIIDAAVITRHYQNLTEPFELRIILSILGMMFQVYALALVINVDDHSAVKREDVKDEVDVISMLVDRSIERDKTLKVTLTVVFSVVLLVLVFLMYFSLVNFARMQSLIQENRQLLEMMS